MKPNPGPFSASIARRSDGEIVVAHVIDTEGIAVAQMMRHDNQEANAALLAAAPEMLAVLKALSKACVNLLETGRDRIISLGGDCDSVDVMEASDPHLIAARAAIVKATGAA